MASPNYRVQENGQVLIERYSGEWVHYDMQYHIRAEFVQGGVQASIYDYLNKPADISGAKVTFQVGEKEITLNSEAGRAIFYTESPIAYTYVTSPGMRPAEIGQQPIEADLIGELKEENSKLNELLWSHGFMHWKKESNNYKLRLVQPDLIEIS